MHALVLSALLALAHLLVLSLCVISYSSRELRDEKNSLIPDPGALQPAIPSERAKELSSIKSMITPQSSICARVQGCGSSSQSRIDEPSENWFQKTSESDYETVKTKSGSSSGEFETRMYEIEKKTYIVFSALGSRASAPRRRYEKNIRRCSSGETCASQGARRSEYQRGGAPYGPPLHHLWSGMDCFAHTMKQLLNDLTDQRMLT